MVAFNFVDYCDINNGGKNVRPGETPHLASANNWGSIESQYPSNPPYPTSWTPDAFFVTYDQAHDPHPFYTEITEHY